jgi:hypothetical protein
MEIKAAKRHAIIALVSLASMLSIGRTMAQMRNIGQGRHPVDIIMQLE